MSVSARRVPVLLAMAVVGCGAAPTPPSPPPPAATSVASTPPPPPPSPACVAATKRLAEIGARLEVHPSRPDETVCDPSALGALAEACPDVADEVRRLASTADEEQRTAEPDWAPSRITGDGRFLVNGESHLVRVWALDGQTPVLVLRGAIEGSWSVTAHDLVLGYEDGTHRLHVVDLAKGTLRRFDEVDAYGESDGSLVVVTHAAILRVDPATLEVAEKIPLAKPLPWGEVHVFGGRRTVVIGDALASFDTGRVVATGVEVHAASRDGRRVVVCKEDRLVVLDAGTGAELASMSTKGTGVCGFAHPMITPDGRVVVLVDAESRPRGERTMVVISLDVATRRVRRFPQPSRGLSTALDTLAFAREGDDGRVCVDYGNMHWRKVDCPWAVGPGGTIAARPEPAAPKIVGVPGIEISRATLPDGRVVVATYEDHTTKGAEQPALEHLRVSIVDAATKRVTRTIEVVPGSFQTALFTGDGTFPPTLRPVSASRVLLETSRGSSSFPPMLVDLEKGEATELDPDLTWLAGRFALVGNDLVDLASGGRWSLVPTEDAWRNARAIEGACGGGGVSK